MSPSPPPSRSLAKDVLWYAAAAGMVGLGTAAEPQAQIVYRDIEPDLLVENTFIGVGFEGLAVDLDNDKDAEIILAEQKAGSYTLAQTNDAGDGPDAVTGIIGVVFSSYGQDFAYFLPLKPGDLISSGKSLVSGYTQATFTFSSYDPNGWVGNGDAFVGLRFTRDDSTHYGWLRVEMPVNGRLLVKDLAYETRPDTPIEAGAMTVAIEPDPDGLPGTHNLSAVYPNPFNPQAAFSLEVAEAQHVRVEVFSALGQRVATLHDGVLSAGSAHAFAIDGAALTSGVYLVRATGERFADTRQVTLLK